MKPFVLILCTGNSCRSQMAEGILRHAVAGSARVASAGSHPTGAVHPMAVQTMAEIGIDLSTHSSKHLDAFRGERVDVVITVCGNAEAACPHFPGAVAHYHWGFDDPAHATGSEADRLAHFREVRDQIRRVFEAFAAGIRLRTLRPEEADELTEQLHRKGQKEDEADEEQD